MLRLISRYPNIYSCFMCHACLCFRIQVFVPMKLFVYYLTFCLRIGDVTIGDERLWNLDFYPALQTFEQGVILII